jgi:uncharacterized protein (TIGR02594 family)
MADADKLQPDDPPWLQIAFRHLGAKEIPGLGADNPAILKFAMSTPGAVDEEIPWCSSFVNFCFEESGIKGTDNRAARSWLNFGTPTNTPVRGCVVVFKRGAEGSGKGHVGFYLSGSTQTGIRVIGGNQSDMVSIVTQGLPFLGYRLGPDQGGLSMADVRSVLNAISNLDQKVDNLYRRANHGEANVPTTENFNRKGLRQDHDELKASIAALATKVDRVKTHLNP